MRSLFRIFSLVLICLLLIASSDAAVNMYAYPSGKSLVTAQSSSVVSVNPGAYQTPDSGQGGTAVTSPLNTGHGNTTSFASDRSTVRKSCRWSGFQPVSGQILSITLKVDWSENGSVSDGGSFFLLEYSLDNGSSWNTLFNHMDIDAPNLGTEQVSLSSGQDISLVQVRDRLTAASVFQDSTSVTGSVSNIRLEVQVVNCIASVPSDRWKGEYFNNQTLSGSPTMVRDDSIAGSDFLNINFGSGSPHPLCAPAVDNFSARWTRTVNLAQDIYRFTAFVDNGGRLYVDGYLRIDKWGNLPPNTYTADVFLSAGSHEIKLEFVEYTDGASASLSWTTVSGANCITSVPAGQWKGEYYNNTNLAGSPAMVRPDGAGFLNFNFGSGGPGSGCGLDVDYFSARWTRTLNFGTGVYRFSVTGDDGVRLYIDGNLQIDKWFSQGATTYTADVSLSSGNHEVKLEYFEGGGAAIALLSWSDPTGVNCLPIMPLPLISNVPRASGEENIASTVPSQVPKRCGQKNSE